MPVTIRPSMKQSKCKHPAMVRGVDERYETCTRCGIVRASHVAAPWVIAYDVEHPQTAELFPTLAPEYRGK